MSDPRAPGGLRSPSLHRLVVLLVGVHSCVLGLLMLLLPRFTLGLMGYGDPGDLFFPSQSGIFLLILGACYLLAVRQPALEAVIVVSKAGAVLFLAVHAAFLGAPPIIALAAAGDGAMLAAVLLTRPRGAAPATPR